MKIDNADFSEANLQGANLFGAHGILSTTFDGADLRGARLHFTTLDKLELISKGVKFDNFTEEGKAFVLQFIKTSWLEFVSGWGKQILLAPFRFISWIFRGLWKILTFPFRLFNEKKKQRKKK